MQDDADAGELKKNQKPVRRNRKQARSNQNEGLKPDFEGPRSSISSHSSDDEGEDLVHTRSSLPTTLLELSQAQGTSMNFNDNPEGEADPKTGNTCNALSGKIKPSQEIGQKKLHKTSNYGCNM